jgi:hypothetical protein
VAIPSLNNPASYVRFSVCLLSPGLYGRLTPECFFATSFFANGFFFSMYYPLHASPTPPQPHNWPTFNFFSEKEGLLFSPIDHPARPISRGGSNQRELLASPDSPSPCASLATLLLPVGRAGEAQRQSCRNAGGANSG